MRKALNRLSQSIENNPNIRFPSETKNRIASSIESRLDSIVYNVVNTSSHMLLLK